MDFERWRSAVGALGLPARENLHVTLVAKEPVDLPGWLGSALHGALGQAVMRLDCRPSCGKDHAPRSGRRCLFARLFGEPAPRADLPGRLRMARPVPLLLRPPPPGRERVLPRGRSIELGVVLLGSAAADAARVVLALERMAHAGLGRGRGRLALGSVYSETEPAARLRPPELAVDPLAVEVAARTPLRLLRKHSQVSNPDFTDLLGAAIFRVASVAAYHGQGVVDLSMEEVRALAQGVSCEEARWEPFSVDRYSSRQDQHHPMEGVLGRARFVGPIRPFLCVLEEAGRLGVGKSPSFGFGLLEVSAKPRGC